MPLLKPNPGVFYSVALRSLAYLPLAVGTVTGGLLSTLAAPLAAVFGKVVGGLG